MNVHRLFEAVCIAQLSHVALWSFFVATADEFILDSHQSLLLRDGSLSRASFDISRKHALALATGLITSHVMMRLTRARAQSVLEKWLVLKVVDLLLLSFDVLITAIDLFAEHQLTFLRISFCSAR